MSLRLPARPSLSHPAFRAVAAVALVAAVVAAGVIAAKGAAAQDSGLTVMAGFGEQTVSANAYGPGDVTVRAGDTITWIINSDEPHTVTFGQGPAEVPPPGWPVTFDIPPGPPGPVNLAAEHSAGDFINTGVIFSGSQVAITMTEEGAHAYNCVIHPGMSGVVNVVGENEAATTQAEADATAAQISALLLGKVDGLRAQTLAAVETENRADGTRLWSVPVGAATEPEPLPGGGTGYLELLEYFPEDLEIRTGDTVRWAAETPHTVTFLEPGQQPQDLGDPFEVPPARPSAEYDGESFYNSGFFAVGPGSPADFELTFVKTGSFGYVCLLHGFIGHTGTVNVGVAPTPAQLPATGAAPPGEGTPAWLIAAAGLIALAALGGGLRFAARRASG